jgi:hypothetical protein
MYTANPLLQDSLVYTLRWTEGDCRGRRVCCNMGHPRFYKGRTACKREPPPPSAELGPLSTTGTCQILCMTTGQGRAGIATAYKKGRHCNYIQEGQALQLHTRWLFWAELRGRPKSPQEGGAQLALMSCQGTWSHY